MKNAFDRLLQLSTGRDIDFALAYEFISPDKILEVPVHATAFFGRRPYPNVISIARWDEDTAANQDYARDAAYELTGIIGKGNVEATEADNMGYGNYGETLTPHFPVLVDGPFAPGTQMPREISPRTSTAIRSAVNHQFFLVSTTRDCKL
jgi:hypothetical protein